MGVYTNTMRFTGLSGIDTESMVQQLMKAEGMKVNRLKATRQITQWKQDAYRNHADSLAKFQNTFFSFSNPATNIRSEGNYGSRSTTVKQNGKESNAVTVSSTSAAPGSRYTIDVKQIAMADSYEGTARVGNTPTSVNDISTIMSKLLSSDDKSITLTLDGVTKTLNFTNAEITSVSSDTTGVQFKNLLNTKLKTAFGTENVGGTQKEKVYTVIAGDKIAFNTQANHNLTISASEALGIESAISSRLDLSSTLGTVFGITGDAKFTINDVEFTVTKNMKVQELMNMVNNSNANVSLGYDNSKEKFTITGKSTGAANAIRFTDTDGFLLSKLKINTTATSVATGRLSVASDAELTIKTQGDTVGTTIYRETNTITFSGLTFRVNEETTAGNPVVIDVAANSEKTFDLIKQFVTAYNEMIGSINKETSTKRPKSGTYSYYQPLTDEEKNAMKENEITKWEEKAKTGLLNSDSLLNSITSSMRSYLYQPVELANGQKISLYQIGITTTSSYNEKGKLEIDEDALRKAIEENGDQVMQLFTKSSSYTYGKKETRTARLMQEGIAERLNDLITDAIGRDGTITAKAGVRGNIVSELTNTMTKEMDDQSERISAMMKALARKENNYYAMFARMEQSVNQSNSQISYLTSAFGG